MPSYFPFPLKKAIKINSLYTSFSPQYESNYYFSGEQHDFWELVFVIDGKIGIAEDDKIYELEKNQIIFHRPMEFHRLWSMGNAQTHLIIMSFSLEGSAALPLGDGVFTLDPVDCGLLFTAFDHSKPYFAKSGILLPIDNEKMEKNSLSLQFMSMRLEFLFLNILRKTTTTAAQINSVSAMNYKKIISVLSEHISENITIPEIAERCNLSVSNLKKTFAKYSGMGVIAYFNKMKISKAISMLAEGASISDTSDALGFLTQNYFSTVFKREMGISPGAYKKKIVFEQSI